MKIYYKINDHKDYYKIIAKVINYKGVMQYDLTKPVGMKQKVVDITRLKEFGWSSKISLEKGLKNTYNWYIENQHKFV